MRYFPLTEADRQEMLASLGMSGIEELFKDIPEHLRADPFSIPLLSEQELSEHVGGLAERNLNLWQALSFLGGGIYYHYIPSAINHLISRSEFYTAYTPYQAEVSQGTLQSIFEYQSLICRLTGMEVANASLYDGASAVAEGALMAHSLKERKELFVSSALNPQYRRVLETYLAHLDLKINVLPLTKGGQTDLGALKGEPFALIIQNPNYFGVLEPVEEAAKKVHDLDGLFIYAFSEAVSLGILPPPGSLGADIVAGEGQSLGIPPSLGGPGLGVFASKGEFMRRMPGRIIGEARDANGERAYVMILQTREQHIRREKATSNICSNQALCALRALIYLCLMGEKGLREVALQSYQRAHYLARSLLGLPKLELVFKGPFFNEFALRVPGNAEDLLSHLLKQRIFGGINLGKYFPERGDSLLLTVTELNSKEDMDRFTEEIRTWLEKKD